MKKFVCQLVHQGIFSSFLALCLGLWLLSSLMTVPAVADSFNGSFPSWSNAKTDFGAVANGTTDDTVALQNAFNSLQSGGNKRVLYLPAGTYCVSSTLNLAAISNIAIIGEDPATTILKWTGPVGGVVVRLNGVLDGEFSRMTVDGQNKTVFAWNQTWDGSTGYSDGGMAYTDMTFKNSRVGFCGGNAGYYAAEILFSRCVFSNCSEVGLIPANYNALDWWVWDSKFTNCGTGIANALTEPRDNELGMKFTSTQAGTIQKMRYYRASWELGIHTGRLWDSNGNLLATVTFSGESETPGWSEATFSTPVQIVANNVYTVSYTSKRYYAYTNNGFSTTFTNGALSSVGTSGLYSTIPGTFPTSADWKGPNRNYFVDIFFQPSTGNPNWLFASQVPASDNGELYLSAGHGGNFHVTNSVFLNSLQSDIEATSSQSFTIRGNYSNGSKRFFIGGNVDPVVLQGNVVVNSLDTATFVLRNGPCAMIDNKVQSLSGATGPVVASNSAGSVSDARLLAVGNTFSVATPFNLNSSVPTRLLDNTTSSTTITTTQPTYPGTAAAKSTRPVIEVTSFTGSAIQTAINTANTSYKGQLPVVHLPYGVYDVSTTLTVPSGCDVQLVGDSFATRLSWTGTRTGSSVLLKLAGPTKATLRNLELYNADINLQVPNCDQVGARIFAENIQIQGYKKVGLEARCLKNAALTLQASQVAGYGAPQTAVGIRMFGPRSTTANNSSLSIYNALIQGEGRNVEVYDDVSAFVSAVWGENSAAAGHTYVYAEGTSGYTGKLTVDGYRMSSISPSLSALPQIQINNFPGTVNLLGTVHGESGQLVHSDVTGSGVGSNVLNILTLMKTGNQGLINTSASARHVVSLADGYTGSIADRGTLDDTFLRNALAQMRSQLPVAQPLASTGTNVTDLRLYRVSVASGAYEVGAQFLTSTTAAPNLQASPAAGTYANPQTLTLQSSIRGTNIRYTTDGSTPTSQSILYSGPIAINSSQTIKAINTAAGLTDSAVLSLTYTITTTTPTPTPTPSGDTTIFTTQTPASFGNDAAYEFGTKFKTTVAGTVSKVRIYTSATEGGTHTVRIWKADGTLLSGPHSWSITAGTAGWKEFTLPTALSLSANVDYIVAVSTSSDNIYAYSGGLFNSPINNGSLVTYVGSGLFTTTLGTMPNSAYNNASYFRDIVFTPAATSGTTIFTTQTPASFGNDAAYEFGTKFKTTVAGSVSKVRIYTNATEGGTHTVRIWKADGTLLAGPYSWSITAGTAGWKEFTLPTALSLSANVDYIVAVSTAPDNIYAYNGGLFNSPINNGSLVTYVGSGLFTTTLGTMPTSVYNNASYFRDIIFNPAATSGTTIFTTQTPASFGNDAAYEFGTKFKTTAAGSVSKVRLYTSATEGGTHTVRIWKADGTLLSGPHSWSITAGSEGWKEFTLPTALSLSANVDYIVAVSTAPDNIYAYNGGLFNSPINNGSLVTYVGSGLFTTTLGTMPTSVYNNASYFRDIVLVP